MPLIVYFDTSIFIELAAKRSNYKTRIKALLKELGEERAKIYTSIITIQEVSVASYRLGEIARDTYGDVMATGAKVRGIDKYIALTCAKNEATLKHVAENSRKNAESFEQRLEQACENRRRKWDCFHVATAQVCQCTEFYTTDDKLLKRPAQLGIKTFQALLPGMSVKKIPSGPLTAGAGEIDV